MADLDSGPSPTSDRLDAEAGRGRMGAAARWFPEGTTCAAGNSVSFATGTSEEHEALQESEGMWVLWHWRDGEDASSRPVDPVTAREWLVRNEHFDFLSQLEVGESMSVSEEGGP